ncbi:DUF6088 family protein [Vibrio vulnificus]|uniref:DUF6088 family protein n=1 Tax=Vibrio vulnificus TaxID=672 RepID=UPI003ED8DE64
MTIAKQVNSYIAHQRYGRVFSLDDFLKSSSLESQKVAVVAALRRCITAKQIIRLSPGFYYKPKKSKFGYLPVDTQELIKAYSRKRHADFVVSGATAVNALGISTQLPMVRSYIMTERVRAELKTVNIKIEYSKALSHFSQNLRVTDKTQKENAMLLWSALHYIDRKRFEDYKSELSDCFQKTLDETVKVKFLEALPPSMMWAKERLGNKI